MAAPADKETPLEPVLSDHRKPVSVTPKPRDKQLQAEPRVIQVNSSSKTA